MSPSLPASRVLAAALVVLALAACGRRGALEAPPDPAAAGSQAGQTAAGTPGEPGADATLPSPVGTPRKGGGRSGFVVPKEPFILDPLL
ncbi:MAG TPA: lipoprotein [Microvirga sp.]|jgi:predicted small lipoprotein YifL